MVMDRHDTSAETTSVAAVQAAAGAWQLDGAEHDCQSWRHHRVVAPSEAPSSLGLPGMRAWTAPALASCLSSKWLRPVHGWRGGVVVCLEGPCGRDGEAWLGCTTCLGSWSEAVQHHMHRGLTWPLLLTLAGLAGSAAKGFSCLLALPFLAAGSSRRFAKDAGSLRLPGVAAGQATEGGLGASAAWYATVACSDAVAWLASRCPAAGTSVLAAAGCC